mgnify:CR=1 FL=1
MLINLLLILLVLVSVGVSLGTALFGMITFSRRDV